MVLLWNLPVTSSRLEWRPKVQQPCLGTVSHLGRRGWALHTREKGPACVWCSGEACFWVRVRGDHFQRTLRSV